MPHPTIRRSTRGCLTCKRRKKKCDEKWPYCERCLAGDFECLGYAHLVQGSSSHTNHSPPDNRITSLGAIAPPKVQGSDDPSAMEINSSVHGVSLHGINYLDIQINPNTSLAYPYKGSSNIPRAPHSDSVERENMVDLIVSQFIRIANQMQFRPLPYALDKVLASRARSSDIILNTMYIGARITQALLDGNSTHVYVGWINNCHRQISGTELSVSETDTNDLANRLSAVSELVLYAFVLLDSSTGYSLLRQGVPVFLRLAARCPQVWANDHAISISHALSPSRHEMSRFILADTICSLAFGTVPLLNYDTTVHEDEILHGKYGFLELVYSCPALFLVLIARINSARIARLVDQGGPNSTDVRELEERVQSWNPTLDYTENAPQSIGRLAVQEAWRQAVLLYAYMGICGVNSADDRIRPLVFQIAQLAATIEDGSRLEAHLFIPCLIAGAAARKERHRAVLRKKILASRGFGAALLRGADFVVVLDHLWHGAAAGGNPVTWEDYVTSRYATIPVDV